MLLHYSSFFKSPSLSDSLKTVGGTVVDASTLALGGIPKGLHMVGCLLWWLGVEPEGLLNHIPEYLLGSELQLTEQYPVLSNIITHYALYTAPHTHLDTNKQANKHTVNTHAHTM